MNETKILFVFFIGFAFLCNPSVSNQKPKPAVYDWATIEEIPFEAKLSAQALKNYLDQSNVFEYFNFLEYWVNRFYSTRSLSVSTMEQPVDNLTCYFYRYLSDPGAMRESDRIYKQFFTGLQTDLHRWYVVRCVAEQTKEGYEQVKKKSREAMAREKTRKNNQMVYEWLAGIDKN